MRRMVLDVSMSKQTVPTINNATKIVVEARRIHVAVKDRKNIKL